MSGRQSEGSEWATLFVSTMADSVDYVSDGTDANLVNSSIERRCNAVNPDENDDKHHNDD